VVKESETILNPQNEFSRSALNPITTGLTGPWKVIFVRFRLKIIHSLRATKT
jgi:hypothetical protein